MLQGGLGGVGTSSTYRRGLVGLFSAEMSKKQKPRLGVQRVACLPGSPGSLCCSPSHGAGPPGAEDNAWLWHSSTRAPLGAFWTSPGCRHAAVGWAARLFPAGAWSCLWGQEGL